MTTYKWLNTEKSRFFTIAVQKRSENEIVLFYSWGGCYSNRGGKKNLSVRTEAEAYRYINLMMKRRKSRGYKLIAPTLH